MRVLDNPLQDIPLFGVLKLPFFDFTETDITCIRCFARDFMEQQEQQEQQEDKADKKRRKLFFI